MTNKNLKKTENEEKNIEKTDENDLEPVTHSTHSTHSKEEESDSTDKLLVKVSSKGPPIPMTNEEHDSFFGNKEGDSSN